MKKIVCLCIVVVSTFCLTQIAYAEELSDSKEETETRGGIDKYWAKSSDFIRGIFAPYVKASFLLREFLVYPEHVSFGHTESELDKLFMWLDSKDIYDGKLGFHLNVQYQQSKLSNYPREVWLEEGYMFADTYLGKFKLGSVYTPFGIPWDHTYYGSVIYYKGYMLDADYGVVLESKKDFEKGVELNSALGYFFREDDLNGATVIGEGYEYLSHGERNTFALRLNPKFKLNDNSDLSLGISALTGEIRSTEADRQVAFEVDGAYSMGPLILTSEYVFYGQNFDNKNPALQGSLFLVEAYYEIYKNNEARFLKNIALTYNFSKDYPDSGYGLGRLHLPAISFKFTDYFKMDVIHVDWRSGDTLKDKSWRIIFYLNF